MTVGVLEHYNVSTRTLEETVNFYENVLGCSRLEEHRAFWRLDAPAEFQRFFQCRLIRRTRKARRLGIKMNGEIGVLRHLTDIRVFREHGQSSV